MWRCRPSLTQGSSNASNAFEGFELLFTSYDFEERTVLRLCIERGRILCSLNQMFVMMPLFIVVILRVKRGERCA